MANTKLNEDVVVPLSKQIDLVDCVNELRKEFDLKIGVFGHCGDGNLHVNFMYNDDEGETSRAVEALNINEEVDEWAVQLVESMELA